MTPSSPPAPRGGRILLCGIPWLARAVDKGRMAIEDRLGDYVFPCPMDLEVLELLSLDEEGFLGLLRCHPDDAGVLAALEGRIASFSPRQWLGCDVFLVRYSRLLDEQEREEGTGSLSGPDDGTFSLKER